MNCQFLHRILIAPLACVVLSVAVVVDGADSQVEYAGDGTPSIILPDDGTSGPVQVIGFDLLNGGDPPDVRVVNLAYGGEVDLLLYIKIEDTFGLVNARISVGIPGLSEQIEISSLDPSGILSIGEMLRWRVRFSASPAPTKDRSLPFYEAGDYPLEFSVSNASGGLLARQPLLNLTIRPLLSSSDSLFCITANKDLPTARHLALTKGTEYPDGLPVMNHSGKGDVFSELTDGIFTDSGVPNWENVYWESDWGPDRRRIDLVLTRDVFVDAAIVVCPSPYLNYRIDRITLEVSSDGENFSRRGKVIPLWDRSRRGLQAVIVSDIDAFARVVRFTLEHDAGAQRILLSEVYLFGS